LREGSETDERFSAAPFFERVLDAGPVVTDSILSAGGSWAAIAPHPEEFPALLDLAFEVGERAPLLRAGEVKPV